RLLAQRNGAQETLQPRLVDRRRRMRGVGDGSEETAGAWRIVEYRSLHRHGHRWQETLTGRCRTPLRAGHVQRLGHPHVVDETSVLQPAKLSLRERLAGRT